MANSAQSWANGGTFAHSPPSRRPNQGQNLAWGYPRMDANWATNEWYNEIKFTHGGRASGPSDTTGGAIGHYTQIVWKGSHKLGCGKGSLRGEGGVYWVCQYSPPGNYIGHYYQNVQPAIRSYQQCATMVRYDVDDLRAGVDAIMASSGMNRMQVAATAAASLG